MRFSILWATLSPAIFGTAFGAYRLLPAPYDQTSLALGVSALFGTLLNLPVILVFLVCAAITALVLRNQPFVIQFAAFGMLALGGMLLLVRQPILAELYGSAEGWHLILCGASLATALICMAVADQVRAK